MTFEFAYYTIFSRALCRNFWKNIYILLNFFPYVAKLYRYVLILTQLFSQAT